MGDQRKIATLIDRGKFPDPVVRVGRAAGWDEKTVNDWIQTVVINDLNKRANGRKDDQD